jgi:hypothetical protein
VFFASLYNNTVPAFVTVASFDNGQSWEPATDTLISAASVPDFANGQFINLGKAGLIQLSHDNGHTFKSLDEGITTPFSTFVDTPPGYELNGLSFFVQTLTNPSTILGSADGVEWSEVVTPSKSLSQLTYVEHLGAWVATDSQQLVASKDFVNWRVLGGPKVPSNDLEATDLIAFANQDNGEWLALFNTWNRWTSYSAFTLYGTSGNLGWSSIASGLELAQKVVAGNGAIVVLTGSGDLQSSTNGGYTWRKQAGPAGAVIAAVRYVAKTFVAVGQDQLSVHVSSDSQVWTTFSFADAPQALVQTNVFVVVVDGEERAAVSLNDGSVRAYDPTAKAWVVWTTIPDSFNGVDGVRSNPKGVFVAVNGVSNEVFTTAA